MLREYENQVYAVKASGWLARWLPWRPASLIGRGSTTSLLPTLEVRPTLTHTNTRSRTWIACSCSSCCCCHQILVFPDLSLERPSFLSLLFQLGYLTFHSTRSRYTYTFHLYCSAYLFNNVRRSGRPQCPCLLIFILTSSNRSSR